MKYKNIQTFILREDITNANIENITNKNINTVSLHTNNGRSQKTQTTQNILDDKNIVFLSRCAKYSHYLQVSSADSYQASVESEK